MRFATMTIIIITMSINMLGCIQYHWSIKNGCDGNLTVYQGNGRQVIIPTEDWGMIRAPLDKKDSIAIRYKDQIWVYDYIDDYTKYFGNLYHLVKYVEVKSNGDIVMCNETGYRKCSDEPHMQIILTSPKLTCP